MARFYGKVGYGDPQDNPTTGISEDVITEYDFSGDVLRDVKNADIADKVNDNISVGNRISIVANALVPQNFENIRYVFWNGTAWKVTSVEVEPPRLILSLGSVYTGLFPVVEEEEEP